MLEGITKRALFTGLLLFPGVLHFDDDLSLGDDVGELLADEGGLLVPDPDLLLCGDLCLPTTLITFYLCSGLV